MSVNSEGILAVAEAPESYDANSFIENGEKINGESKKEESMIFEVQQTEIFVPLFENWQETLIWSCLQKVMGHLYTNSVDKPASVMAILGDFCYFAGKPDKELVLYKPEWFLSDFIIMVPQNKAWARLIENCYGKKAKKVTRYAIKKERGIFDKGKLEEVVNGLPDSYTIQMMDEALFWRCREIAWCKDWVAQYDDYEMYQRFGLGVVILKDGEPVSGASSYSGYLDGIEIEIGTNEKYRRQGLAYICGAKLILECLKRNLYPSWDAQNKWSVGLAEKLGYHFDHEYPAYEIWGY